MHLVIATPEYPPHSGGGIATFYRTLTPEYVKAGHRVTILVANPFSPDFADYEHDGVVVKCVPLEAVARRSDRLSHLSAAPVLRRWLGAARALADSAERVMPDIVETTDFAVAFAPFACRPGSAPVIVQMHGSIGQISEHEPVRGRDELDARMARVIEASLLPACDALQAYSPLNAAEWRGRLHSEVTFVPPALPIVARPMTLAGGQGSTGPGSVRPSTGPGRTATSEAALVVARVQPWKGPELLCRAVERLGTKARGLKIAWVGRDTPTYTDGHSFSGYLGQRYPRIWGRVIEPAGPKPPAEVQALQATARFVIVPSDWDTFNFTAAESMAAGRVVLCSDGVGASFLIRDGVNGLLFKSGDADSLCAALERAMQLTANEAAAVGETARSTVAEQLDPARVARTRVEHACAVAASGRKPSSVPAWLAEFVDTDGDRPADHEFLANVSIRDLSRHLARRLRDRMFGA